MQDTYIDNPQLFSRFACKVSTTSLFNERLGSNLLNFIPMSSNVDVSLGNEYIAHRRSIWIIGKLENCESQLTWLFNAPSH